MATQIGMTIHEDSPEGMKSELDLFTVPFTVQQVDSGCYVYVQPLAPIYNADTIDFVVPGSGDNYLDLSKTVLEIGGRFINKDKEEEPIPDGDDFYPVNNLMHSLFKQIDVTLNDVQVTQGSAYYPYKAYIEKLTNYSAGVKNSALTSALWYTDNAIQTIQKTVANTEEKRRQDIVKGGQYVEMVDKLHLEIFNIDRYLLNNVTIKMRILRSTDAFYVLTPTAAPLNVYFKLEACRLKVRRVKLATNVLLAQATLLSQRTAKYPIDLVQMKVFSITAGSASANIDNIFFGSLPSRLIVGMVELAAMEGDVSKNPFNFEHFNMKSFALYVDGVQMPTEGYQFNFVAKKNNYLPAYQDFLECTGKWGSNKDNGITRKMWAEGCTLLAFDLTPDMIAASNAYPVIRQGALHIDIKFTAGLPANINLIVYGENNHLMEIDNNRMIALDYKI
jgi:hypothetical protein